ncbi:MAG: DUF1488 family protein [Candidatus Acidiferrum sp.]
MPTPNEKLAESLDVLKELQGGGRRVFRSGDLSRVHRERLLENRFLQEVMKGWLISSSPHTKEGDTTPWHASFWEFCARYCAERFGEDWHLSAEQSLLLHGERTVISDQVVVNSPEGANNTVKLLFGTSLYDLKILAMPPKENLVLRDGLRLSSPAAALVDVAETFFAGNPVETQVVLASLPDATDLLRLVLNGGHSAKAGYLSGALRETGRGKLADEVVKTMKDAGYDVRERNPFDAGQIFARLRPSAAPIAGRLQTLWETTREAVVTGFPKAPGLPRDKAAYLHNVDEIYKSDAYHSLSIEGYSVTPALIERVRQGNWNPESDAKDGKDRDTLAARGYWQAFQLVKKSVDEVLGGAPAGSSARAEHMDWYRQLFQPQVAAGAMRPGDFAGYRNSPVYLRTSRYVPPRWEAVRDAMPMFFDLLEREDEASVRAVLGHWLFGYIHPYPDGNGRVARFLMNVMLASGGYPWTVIRLRDRNSYLTALDRASIDTDIRPFTAFLAERASWLMEKHDLEFPDRKDADAFAGDTVVFEGRDGGKRVRCAIDGDAIDEDFAGEGRDKVELFRENRDVIEETARRKYLAGDTEGEGSILIRSGDVARAKR